MKVLERNGMDSQSLQSVANNMRIDIVKMIAEAGSGHPGGSLSCVEILTALYFGGVLNHDARNPQDPARDRFILAKAMRRPRCMLPWRMPDTCPLKS